MHQDQLIWQMAQLQQHPALKDIAYGRICSRWLLREA